MSEKRNKKLRKQAKYEKSYAVQLAGQYNLTIGTGSAIRVVPVDRYELIELTPEQQAAKNLYKSLKKSV